MKRQHIVGAALVALGAGVAANALLGPLALGVIRSHNSASGIHQLIGGEAISLIVVAPLSVAAGALWLRGHRVAPALYALYTYTTEIVVAQYARYPGNSERFLPLHIGLLALGGTVAVAAWSALESAPPPIPTPRLRAAAAIALLVPSALFALNWLGQLAAYTGGERSQAYRDDPILWWLIKGLDLGILIPLSLTVGIGVLRNRPSAARAAPGLAGFLACLVGSVAALVAVAALMALGIGGVAIPLICGDGTQPGLPAEPASARRKPRITLA